MAFFSHEVGQASDSSPKEVELDKKSGRRCSATYGLERAARDKGNTMNDSESMLTYRKEDESIDASPDAKESVYRSYLKGKGT
ncbi:hypothetical protein [Bacillus sp. Hm123]|uniref:hypothetical protein n=1 Tax=Bacillus sp. Hm123 TaxID=3450745 RepID=UPI003F42F8A1